MIKTQKGPPAAASRQETAVEGEGGLWSWSDGTQKGAETMTTTPKNEIYSGKQQPPANIEAEKAVLGAMLLKSEAIPKAAAILTESDFYRESHRLAFSTMLQLNREGEPVDLVTVVEALRKAGKLEQAGGIAFVSDLANTVPGASAIEHHAAIVKEQAERRRLLELAEVLAAQARDLETVPADAAKAAALAAMDPRRIGGVYRAEPANVGMMHILSHLGEPRPNFPTGFTALDQILHGGLKPGLYAVGAISSLGKTTFIQQAADHIAAAGQDVLFFSLEMGEAELVSKSLSRKMAELDSDPKRSNARSNTAILYDYPNFSQQQRDLLADATAQYDKDSKHLYYSIGLADIGTSDIRAAVQYHKVKHNVAPVVIVDYLQILKPADPRATDKQNTDRAVVELKRISRDFDTPVIAISSFNRDSYKQSASFAALKESGSIEYSADVVIALQLAGAGEKDFDVDVAKQQNPRKVEAVILKNRNGRTGGKVFFDYYPALNYFVELSAAGDLSSGLYSLKSFNEPEIPNEGIPVQGKFSTGWV